MVHEGQESAVNKSARHTRELVRRLGKLTEAQAAMGWGVILLILSLIGAIYLNQSSQVAAVGRHVQQLEYEYNQVQRENADLKREIAESQSLERLHRETERMGFVPSSSWEIEYLVIPDYPEEVTQVLGASVPQEKTSRNVETIREALALVLQDRVDDLMRGESGD